MNFEISPKSTEIQANWYNAILYCQFLDIAGKTDWRLPTLDELDYIYKSENDFDGSYYWSSTEFNGSYAWYQHMSNGSQNYSGGKSGSLYVRVVRSLS